jgi:hypothetical protein
MASPTPSSFERRPGMPRPASVHEDNHKESSEIDAQSDINDNNESQLGPMQEREERDDDVLYTLPRAQHRRSYSFIEDDEVTTQENSESEPESAGPTPEED